MYHLNQFPLNISKVETKILNLNCTVTIHKEQLSFMDAEIEIAIATSENLKNEQQRKAERIKLKQLPDYLQTKSTLAEVTEKRDKALIELNLLRNQFSVAKLEFRANIANLEAVA